MSELNQLPNHELSNLNCADRCEADNFGEGHDRPFFPLTPLPDRLRSDRGLIIGYGNTLRGDDGVGVLLAETLERELAATPSQIQVIATPQLLPELAATIATVEWVIFLDAISGDPNAETPEMPTVSSTGIINTGMTSTGITSTEITSTGMTSTGMTSTEITSTGMTNTGTTTPSNVFSLYVHALQPTATHFDPHTSSPEALLGLARDLFGQCPPQVWLVGIPAEDFTIGAPCSEVAIAGMTKAWKLLSTWLQA